MARLQVDEKGLVTSVTIVEANPRRVFDREVIQALSQWKFQPEGDRCIARDRNHLRAELAHAPDAGMRREDLHT